MRVSTNHVTHMNKPNNCAHCGGEYIYLSDRQGQERWYSCEDCSAEYFHNGNKGKWLPCAFCNVIATMAKYHNGGIKNVCEEHAL